MYSEENRALNYAIAASIVLHGVLLFGIAQRDRPRPGESQIPSILARVVESPPAAPAAATAGAPPGDTAVDPGSLERYRLELKLVAAKHKRYPRMATDNNWKGVVALRVVVGPSGQLASLTVMKTSGHEVLDRQA